MKQKNKVKIVKTILLVGVLALIIALIIYLFPIMKNLSTVEGQLAFKEKIQNAGFIGMLILFGLQLAQIFLIILPGEPLEIVAGMCYGGLWGTIFIMASACITSIAIYFLVRKYGRKFVYNFYNKEKIKKIENSKLFQNSKKIELIMFILFFLPGTPKDLMTYIGGLLPIKPSRFILIATFARFPSIVSSTLAGSSIMKR